MKDSRNRDAASGKGSARSVTWGNRLKEGGATGTGIVLPRKVLRTHSYLPVPKKRQRALGSSLSSHTKVQGSPVPDYQAGTPAGNLLNFVYGRPVQRRARYETKGPKPVE
jgi:hypothetical protein